MKIIEGVVDSFSRAYYIEERLALKTTSRRYVQGDIFEQRTAAHEIQRVMDEACLPGGFYADRQLGRTLIQMMTGPEFGPVFERAQELFLASNERGVAYHRKRNGRVVLQAAAKYGFGVDAIDWKKVVASVLHHVENAHVSNGKSFVQDIPYRDLLRDLVSEHPRKPAVGNLYAEVAGQVAQRVCELGDAAARHDRRAHENEKHMPLKVRRVLMLLVDGIERQRVLDMEKDRAAKLRHETIEDMAFGLALKRLPNKKNWLMALGRS